MRSNGSSVWPYVERLGLELESALPECLVDYLLVFPDSEWRKKRADKVAESLNNIAVSDLLTVNCVDWRVVLYRDISRECSVSQLTTTGRLLSTSNYPRGSCW